MGKQGRMIWQVRKCNLVFCFFKKRSRSILSQASRGLIENKEMDCVPLNHLTYRIIIISQKERGFWLPRRFSICSGAKFEGLAQSKYCKTEEGMAIMQKFVHAKWDTFQLKIAEYVLAITSYGGKMAQNIKVYIIMRMFISSKLVQFSESRFRMKYLKAKPEILERFKRCPLFVFLSSRISR